MSTKRQKVQAKALEIAGPIVGELGMELVDAEFTHRGREQVLCLYLDRSGGVSIDDLQEASHAVERALEVSDLVAGRYRLEVSSPGIDRPLKTAEDYRKNIGAVVRVKTFQQLQDGSRVVRAKLTGISGDAVTLADDSGRQWSLAFVEIASARPEPDWDEMLKKTAGPQSTTPRVRRSR